MSEMIERVALAISMERDGNFEQPMLPVTDYDRELAAAAIKAMREPTEEQWGGLARHIIMWMDMQPKTPRALFTHLERSGVDVPQWLRDEPEMQALDHVPSKGTRAAIVYRAMIDAALVGEG